MLSRLRSPIRPKVDQAKVDQLAEHLIEALFYASRGDQMGDPRTHNAVQTFVRELIDLLPDHRGE